MATSKYEDQRLFLDDRIEILDRNAEEAFPAGQVFRIVAAILALVRVCTLRLAEVDPRISPMTLPGRSDYRQRFYGTF